VGITTAEAEGRAEGIGAVTCTGCAASEVNYKKLFKIVLNQDYVEHYKL